MFRSKSEVSWLLCISDESDYSVTYVCAISGSNRVLTQPKGETQTFYPLALGSLLSFPSVLSLRSRFRYFDACCTLNPFTPDRAKSKIDKFCKITNWVKLTTKQHHSKVLLNSFPMNGHTLGFCPQNQKLENFVSPKVSHWESNEQHHNTAQQLSNDSLHFRFHPESQRV